MKYDTTKDALAAIADEFGAEVLLGERLKPYLLDFLSYTVVKADRDLVLAVHKYGSAEILSRKLDASDGEKQSATEIAIKRLTEAYIAQPAAEKIIGEFIAALGWDVKHKEKMPVVIEYETPIICAACGGALSHTDDLCKYCKTQAPRPMPPIAPPAPYVAPGYSVALAAREIQDALTPPQDYFHLNGQTVFAKWPPDGYYYPGKVMGILGNMADIHFMDNQVEICDINDIVELEEALNHMDFQSDWMRKGIYYDCRFTAPMKGGKIKVHYIEDDVKETVNLSQLRASNPPQHHD